MLGSWDDPPARATRGLRRPSLDARSWDHPSHPLMIGRLRPCSGKARLGAPGLGGLRSLNFLSILRKYSSVVAYLWATEVLAHRHSFPQHDSSLQEV